MITTYDIFYSLFGSVGLLLSGFIAIAYNKMGAHALMVMAHYLFHPISPKPKKVRSNGLLFNISRAVTITIGLFAIIVAFLVLRRLISFI